MHDTRSFISCFVFVVLVSFQIHRCCFPIHPTRPPPTPFPCHRELANSPKNDSISIYFNPTTKHSFHSSFPCGVVLEANNTETMSCHARRVENALPREDGWRWDAGGWGEGGARVAISLRSHDRVLFHNKLSIMHCGHQRVDAPSRLRRFPDSRRQHGQNEIPSSRIDFPSSLLFLLLLLFGFINPIILCQIPCHRILNRAISLYAPHGRAIGAAQRATVCQHVAQPTTRPSILWEITKSLATLVKFNWWLHFARGDPHTATLAHTHTHKQSRHSQPRRRWND